MEVAEHKQRAFHFVQIPADRVGLVARHSVSELDFFHGAGQLLDCLAEILLLRRT